MFITRHYVYIADCAFEFGRAAPDPAPTMDVAGSQPCCFQADAAVHGRTHTGRASALLLCSLNINDKHLFPPRLHNYGG